MKLVNAAAPPGLIPPDLKIFFMNKANYEFKFLEVSRLLFSTPQGYCGGIDTKGITGIADHGDRPVIGRIIESPYVDLFREFQGANPSNTAGFTGARTGTPLGTLPVAGRPGDLTDQFTASRQGGAISAIRRWNIKNSLPIIHFHDNFGTIIYAN
mgnify:CR=1 FL=1